ncbi:hypothetical protein [Thaumasiovibrio sp. DFM-14]|uniref:hypothetical protein n=1 Tax=Thaumasiovibrio sp. DFM-14 TaxID=3384792 RepID=UPI00399F8F18
MNNKSLFAILTMAMLSGCNANEDSSGGSGGHRFDQGWGVTPGTSYSSIQSRINAIPSVVRKTVDNGYYVTRSRHMGTACGPEHNIGSDSAAYNSAHFELGIDNKRIPLSDIQRIAGIVEVSLEMIAEELNVLPRDLISHAHTDSNGEQRLGVCILSGKSSNGAGHGNEMVVSQSNTHGGVYEFTLLKHELAHLIDSQFNNNEFAYNLTPNWWVEGFAENVTGTKPLSKSAWQSQHKKYVGDQNIVTLGGAPTGGYEAYSLYSTMVAYLRNKGLTEEAFFEFVQSDRWHADGTTNFDPEGSCKGQVPSNYGLTTGSCGAFSDVMAIFSNRFNYVSGRSGGELSGFDDFETNYYQLISDWLSSR